MNNPETPIQEAVSIITIAAILVAAVCYMACLNSTPVISPALFQVASWVYAWFPALNGLRSAQLPMVVSSATIGGVFWLVTIPFAGLLARLFNASQLASLERQTIKLKRNRAKIIKNRRERDGFDVN